MDKDIAAKSPLGASERLVSDEVVCHGGATCYSRASATKAAISRKVSYNATATQVAPWHCGLALRIGAARDVMRPASIPSHGAYVHLRVTLPSLIKERPPR